MQSASHHHLSMAAGVNRRLVLGGMLVGVSGPALAHGRNVITLLGDSITAGYGLPAAAALPAAIRDTLAQLGVPAEVRGAGVSGDTSAGGLARLDFSVQADTRLCLVELGGNDLLHGQDPAATQANLTRIVSRLKARKIGVVLAGLRAASAIGSAYAREFNSVFPAVAKAQSIPLYQDLLAGVQRHAEFMQRDGLHPNADGVRIIAARLAPVLVRALASH